MADSCGRSRRLLAAALSLLAYPVTFLLLVGTDGAISRTPPVNINHCPNPFAVLPFGCFHAALAG